VSTSQSNERPDQLAVDCNTTTVALARYQWWTQAPTGLPCVVVQIILAVDLDILSPTVASKLFVHNEIRLIDAPSYLNVDEIETQI
jgi:hypothetical protein